MCRRANDRYNGVSNEEEDDHDDDVECELFQEGFWKIAVSQ